MRMSYPSVWRLHRGISRAIGVRMVGHAGLATLVVAEHDNIRIKPATFNTVTAAKKLGKDVHLLVAGANCARAASEGTQISGVSKVLALDHASLANFLAENVAAAIKTVVQGDGKYAHILAPDTAGGRNYLPRLGALLDAQPITGVISIVSADTFVRPIYAGNALATVRSTDGVKLVSVRTTAFEATGSQPACTVEHLQGKPVDSGLSTWISDDVAKSDRPDLTTAKIVVSGGRALKSAENFGLLYSLADNIGAAVGASRAAVDAGYCPNDMQVGQTGKVVAPQLYVAIGISGAIQHLAGMKDSKTIVAINKDADAPVFAVADYGLVGDLFAIVPELTSKVK